MTLESMAHAFGVSPAFMDAELAEFIVAGRVSAKIDKVRSWPVTASQLCNPAALQYAPQECSRVALICHLWLTSAVCLAIRRRGSCAVNWPCQISVHAQMGVHAGGF